MDKATCSKCNKTFEVHRAIKNRKNVATRLCNTCLIKQYTKRSRKYKKMKTRKRTEV